MMKTMFLMFAMTVSAFAGNLDLKFKVDVSKVSTDSFFVNLQVKGISEDSIVYQFASTAPGTYQIMDVGRFVGNFRAFDGSGKELKINRIGTNQFAILKAKSLASISYQIEDSYDTPIKEHPIGPMSGTTIEENNVVINGQLVFGFFKGHQSNPAEVTYVYPSDWKIGTALEGKNGTYKADTFDHLVDSPVMFGKLTVASTKVGGTKVDLYCYSDDGKFVADTLLSYMTSMLNAADRFIGGLPVKRYTFLYKFSGAPMPSFGAWEHSYSSFYILPSGGLGGGSLADYYSTVSTIAAHEFFHVVTPLNIHSEIIEKFNFETPVASRHLWFYEGTTEWAAQMMSLRNGLIDEKEFLKRMSQKMTTNEQFNPAVSLVDLSLGSYGELQKDYINIYAKGALTAMVLDLRLLELSGGKTGLRNVVQKLAKEYGPKKAFQDDKFFDIIVKMTNPEVADFFVKYVQGAEPLPIQEYMAKAGFDYVAEFKTGKYSATRGLLALDFIDGKLMVTQADSTNEVNRTTGIRAGDELMSVIYKGEEKSLFDPGYNAFKATMQPDEEFAWKVKRNGTEMVLSGKLGKVEVINKHVISPVQNPTKEQMAFRNLWIGKL